MELSAAPWGGVANVPEVYSATAAPGKSALKSPAGKLGKSASRRGRAAFQRRVKFMFNAGFSPGVAFCGPGEFFRKL
jgi:hypothetical protein